MAKPIPANPVADVPVNWTAGQIVSPNGSEVGLDSKHGYNYLGQKVNEALTDIGILNENAESLAQDIEEVAQFQEDLGLTVSSGMLCVVFNDN